ncbi:catechol 2,3-dioxygenase [Bacillus tuaregi]|uniref:catechol 2,3-dioxygenase n=1 Tax=Bacillus tuaregi TaxID=1816695 RepID=UPI0008F804CE|nr:catechol 2,3-dioxygenase [Bacillus tuaregi]
MPIMRLGHVQLRVPNWEASVDYYKNVLGLIETARDEKHVYLKAWDEYDHHSVILEKADSAGLEHLAFKVRYKEDLDMYEQKLQDYGVVTERIAAGTRIAEGEAVRFQLPTKQYVELYHEIEQIGNGLPRENPAPWPDGLKGMAPPRLDHLLISGEDVEGTTKLMMEVFDFCMAERAMMDEENVLATWLFVTNTPHDLAIIKGPDAGVHHIGFYLDNWNDVLKAADIIGKNNVPLDKGPVRHGITRGTTIYFFDPSGNRNEVYANGYITYPDFPTITWTAEKVGEGISFFDKDAGERFTTVFS